MGRLRKRPNVPPEPVGDEIYPPKTPMNPEADIPEGVNPVVPEPPTNGIPVPNDIPLEPGRPRAPIPIPPGEDEVESEIQRTPNVQSR